MEVEVTICRACLGTAPVMFNIFENVPEENITIADLISQCTKYDVSKGDSYPENICESCVHLAQNCLEIQQTLQRSHHLFLQMNKDKERANTIKRSAGPLTCSLCSKSTAQNHLHLKIISSHIRTHTGERPYKCSHCSKSFSQKSNLQVHLRTHTGERPYKCSHCINSFSLKTTLQAHIRTHTGERPYKCSHCSKSFAVKSNQQSHIRTHTGERPYKCSHCSKSFRCKLQLDRHLPTHTGELSYKCSHCSKSFALKHNQQRHIRSHTGERPYKYVFPLLKIVFPEK